MKRHSIDSLAQKIINSKRKHKWFAIENKFKWIKYEILIKNK